MKPWQIKVTRFFHLSLEMLLLFLIIIPLYYAEEKELPIFPFIVLVATAIIFYEPFIQKFKTEKVGILLIPIIGLVGISVGFHFFFAFLISTIIFWRVLSHNKDNDPNEMNLFIITFIVGVVFFLYFFFTGKNEIFLIITFFQFFLIVLLKMLKLAFQSSKSSTNKVTQMKWQLGSFAALGGITLIAIFSYQMIHTVVVSIFKLVFYVVWLLGVPFVYLASLFNFELRRRGPEEEAGFYSGPESDLTLDEATAANFDILLWIAGGAILIVILYIIFRKSGSLILREYIQTNDQEELSSFSQDDHKKGWFRSSRPKNEIRRLFYDFEKYMAKKGHGRSYNETVEDWFARVNADEELKRVVALTYRSVRYGDKQISSEEKNRYRQALKEIKKNSI